MKIVETMFKDLDIWYDDTMEDNKPFVIACRDRETISEERWVLASLSYSEAQELYEYLKKRLL